MKLKTLLLAAALAAASFAPASAATFRFAFQGDLKSLDPYSLNETFTHGVLGNVYEGLTKRDKELKIIPGLAARWEVLEPTRWRFYLRKGVKFQSGEDRTADDEVIFTTISNDATRVAALLSGDVDWADPIPLQDVERINASANAQVLQGPELRTIFLGFDQYRNELKYSNIKGKNPFKDVRVRKAFYLAIDENAIAEKVMRKAAVPSALMISPLLFPLAKDFTRPKADPNEAKKLLTEAGYPNGFEVTMDCPNDRYVNDEQICQAITAMLSRVGVKINLLAQPKAKYFAKILVSGGYDSSFYLLGWTPGSFDSWNVLANMYRCRDEKGAGGNNNVGNYCNPKMEEMIKQILVEGDTAKRDQLIKAAYQLGQEQDWGYVPLHQQALAWGVSKKVKVVQRADNQILFYWFRKE